MTILVTAASRHGSTREIAETIATELRAQALAVEVRDPQTVTALDRYDAVILGSAVYAGKWLAAADGFARKHRARLATIPVWLFSAAVRSAMARTPTATSPGWTNCRRRSARASTSSSPANWRRAISTSPSA